MASAVGSTPVAVTMNILKHQLGLPIVGHLAVGKVQFFRDPKGKEIAHCAVPPIFQASPSKKEIDRPLSSLGSDKPFFRFSGLAWEDGV